MVVVVILMMMMVLMPPPVCDRRAKKLRHDQRNDRDGKYDVDGAEYEQGRIHNRSALGVS